MSFRPTLCLGRIIYTPAKPHLNLDELMYVVALPPEDTLPEKGKIVLCRIYWGLKSNDWEISYGEYVINCAVRLRITKDQFERCRADDDCLPQEKIDELYEAYAAADLKNALGY